MLREPSKVWIGEYDPCFLFSTTNLNASVVSASHVRDHDLLQVRLHPSEWFHLPHGSRCHDCPHLAGRHIFILDMDDLGDDDVAST